MTLTLLLKSVWKKIHTSNKLIPLICLLRGMQMKIWESNTEDENTGMKNLEDEKLGMNNLTMQYIFFLIQTLWLRFKVLILQRQHSHIPLYVCWLCYVPISIFLSFTPVLSINTNASRTLKFLRFCTQNTRETFKSASLYDPKVYKQEDPQSYFCASYMASKSLFYVFKSTSLCLLSTTIYTENWKCTTFL